MMKKKGKNKLSNPFKYIFFIALSTICFTYAIWLNKETINILSAEKEKLLAQIEKYKEEKEDLKKALEKESPLNKKSGLLWKDPNSNNYLISLGKINGIKENSIFIVRNNKDIPVGKAKVKSVEEKISIVEIIDTSLSLNDPYYKVEYREPD